MESALLDVGAEADDSVLLLYLARVYVFHLLARVLLGRELGRAVIVDDALDRRAVIAHVDGGMLLADADDIAFNAVLLRGRRRLPCLLLLLRAGKESERERKQQRGLQKNQFAHSDHLLRTCLRPRTIARICQNRKQRQGSPCIPAKHRF